MNIFTENPDFYPTPRAVIERMMMGEEVIGKVILEPSAGSGNIVDWLKSNGAGEVIACENDKNNLKLLRGKCRIIAEDFLTLRSEDVSHINMIVMNPPFSRGAEHILHAFNIAPPGCTVIALCNSSNLNRYTYTKTLSELKETIELYGHSEELGDCFKTAERRTEVSVSLIKLYKEGENDDEFAGYFFSQFDEDVAGGQEGLMQYNFVRDIVNRFTSAVRRFDEVMQASKEINELADFYDFKNEVDEKTGEVKQVKQTYGYLPITFGAIVSSEGKGASGTSITHQEYKKALQKHYWHIIFQKMNMEKYATKQLREQINRFVEQQSNVPFTMRNIYRVVEIVIQTNGSRMMTAIIEAFDKICSYSAENSTAGETWKTNANYMVNRRFIVPRICEGYKPYWHNESYPKLNFGYYSDRVELEDICKALCFLTGRNYDEIEELREHEGRENWGEWFEWGFFKCRAYKKGTMHLEFLDEDVWFKFNQTVAKEKGWSLPKRTQKERKKPERKASEDKAQMTLF